MPALSTAASTLCGRRACLLARSCAPHPSVGRLQCGRSDRRYACQRANTRRRKSHRIHIAELAHVAPSQLLSAGARIVSRVALTDQREVRVPPAAFARRAPWRETIVTAPGVAFRAITPVGSLARLGEQPPSETCGHSPLVRKTSHNRRQCVSIAPFPLSRQQRLALPGRPQHKDRTAERAAARDE